MPPLKKPLHERVAVIVQAVFVFIALLAVSVSHGASISGGRIINDQGQRITIKGVNWFGFETETRVVHGLWARSMTDMLDQMKSIGFNAVRVPFCPATFNGAATNSIDYSLNPALQGLSSVQVLDVLATELEKRGMYFLLDHHRPDCLAISELWYVNGYTEAQWISTLKTVAARYKDYKYFLGMDLQNEPHGAARWGSGNAAVDWNSAAERAAAAVLSVAPNALIFVEGVSDGSYCTTVSSGIWWGGNVNPQLCKPLNIPAERLVLSPHVYGPDVFVQTYFNDASFPSNMPAIWNSHFGDAQTQGYSVVLGETGGKYGAGLAKDKTFQDALFAYLKQHGIYDVFYWSWNPNSGDTGGILNDDWKTVRQDKVALLQSFWAAADSASGTTPTTPAPTTPTDPSTPSPSPPVSTTPSPSPTTPTPTTGMSNGGYGGGGALDYPVLGFLGLAWILVSLTYLRTSKSRSRK
jgi:endoglucanase